MSPLISIIIPCYNAIHWLRETLDSVIAQQTVPLEIILVDDGSTDGSADFVETNFPLVKVVRTPNGGVSRARNIGTTLATGRFVKYLDNDDLIAPGTTFENEMESLLKSGADIGYGDWQKYRKQPDGSYVLAEVVTSQIPDAAETWFLVPDSWVTTHALLYKQEVAKSVTWNEGLRLIQDARYLIDCATAGYTFAHHSGVVAIRRLHSDSLSYTSSSKVEYERFLSAMQLKDKWSRDGALTASRRTALTTVLARSAFAFATSNFDWEQTAKVLDIIKELDANFVPHEGSPKFLHLTQLLGYRNALKAAYYYHKTRISLGGKKHEGPPMG